MSTDRVQYRECAAGDVPAVLTLWRESGAVPGHTDTEQALRLRLKRDSHLFVVAIVDGQVVGCLIGGWDGWRGNLYRLVVHPEHRRKGIAGKLVEIVESRLAALGATRVYALAVKPELDESATAFWKTAGYAVNPRLTPYVKTIGDDR